MKKVCSFFAIIQYCVLSAQAPDIDWQKTFGGDWTDRLFSINQTSDGGFIIGGDSGSGISGDKTVALNGNSGLGDYWIIKTDSEGSIEWQKSIGGFGAEGIKTIINPTTDGGYIVGGISYSDISGDKTENSYGYRDYWIVRLDSLGNIIWDKTLGGNLYEDFEAIIQTPDGGFLVGGTSDSNISGNKTENKVGYVSPISIVGSDYWVVKLNANGGIEWQNTVGGYGNDYLTDMINTPDGGYLVSGRSDSNISGDKSENSRGTYDFWILKLDNTGQITWQRTIGGNGFDVAWSLCVTNNNSYIIGGRSSSDISGEKTESLIAPSGTDLWVLKIDLTGAIVWQKTIGGTGQDFLTCIAKDNHGDFLLGGYSDSNAGFNKTENSRGDIDFWVIKITDSGLISWDKTLGGDQSDGIYGICYVNTDDSFIFGGTSKSSNTGDKTDVSRGMSDYWIIKLAPESLATHVFDTASISVYPNPTNDILHITLPKIYKKIDISITNILGEIIQKKSESNTLKIDLDFKGSNGIYFLNLTNENNETISFKVLKK